MSLIERRYVIRRCPECHGQATEMGSAHFTDCPNTYAAFVPEEAEVVWPDTTQGGVVLADDERKALAWAARKGAHLLRAEGWADMKRNAEILDGVLPRLEGGSRP